MNDKLWFNKHVMFQRAMENYIVIFGKEIKKWTEVVYVKRMDHSKHWIPRANEEDLNDLHTQNKPTKGENAYKDQIR